MSEQSLESWQQEAAKMRRRDLTADEKTAISEEMLKGTLKPHLDKRARKNAIRAAIDSVRPGKKKRTATDA